MEWEEEEGVVGNVEMLRAYKKMVGSIGEHGGTEYNAYTLRSYKKMVGIMGQRRRDCRKCRHVEGI